MTERRGRAGGGAAAVAAVTMPHIKMQWPFKATKEGQLSAVADEVSGHMQHTNKRRPALH